MSASQIVKAIRCSAPKGRRPSVYDHAGVADAGEDLQEVLRQPERDVGRDRPRDEQVAVVVERQRVERVGADVRRQADADGEGVGRDAADAREHRRAVLLAVGHDEHRLDRPRRRRRRRAVECRLAFVDATADRGVAGGVEVGAGDDLLRPLAARARDHRALRPDVGDVEQSLDRVVEADDAEAVTGKHQGRELETACLSLSTLCVPSPASSLMLPE